MPDNRGLSMVGGRSGAGWRAASRRVLPLPSYKNSIRSFIIVRILCLPPSAQPVPALPACSLL